MRANKRENVRTRMHVYKLALPACLQMCMLVSGCKHAQIFIFLYMFSLKHQLKCSNNKQVMVVAATVVVVLIVVVIERKKKKEKKNGSEKLKSLFMISSPWCELTTTYTFIW